MYYNYVTDLETVYVRMLIFFDLFTGPIEVGYEFTLYTTPEGVEIVELCVVIFQPPTRVAPRDFVISTSTRDGSATGMYVRLCAVAVSEKCMRRCGKISSPALLYLVVIPQLPMMTMMQLWMSSCLSVMVTLTCATMSPSIMTMSVRMTQMRISSLTFS